MKLKLPLKLLFKGEQAQKEDKIAKSTHPDGPSQSSTSAQSGFDFLQGLEQRQEDRMIVKSELRPFVYDFTLTRLSTLFSALDTMESGELLKARIAASIFELVSASLDPSSNSVAEAKIIHLIGTSISQAIDSCLQSKDGILEKVKCRVGPVAGISVCGGRQSNEDRFSIHPFLDHLVAGKSAAETISFYGVYDGHGGKSCADYVASHLHLNLMNHPLLNESPKQAIHDAFLLTNTQWVWKVKNVQPSLSIAGSTAVTALVHNRTLYVAWSGDSSAILFLKNGTWIEFVVPHKPSYESERKRIVNLGGFVQNDRVNGTLAVSRSFGDMNYACIRPDPEILEYTLSGEEWFLLLACDGLTDVMDSGDIFNVASCVTEGGPDPYLLRSSVDRLVSEAIKRGTTDNVTAIIVPLNVSYNLLRDRKNPIRTVNDLIAKSDNTNNSATWDSSASYHVEMDTIASSYPSSFEDIAVHDDKIETVESVQEPVENTGRDAECKDDDDKDDDDEFPDCPTPVFSEYSEGLQIEVKALNELARLMSPAKK